MPFAGLMPLFAIFETPLAALTVIAGSAFIPIIIHLLNRRRYIANLLKGSDML